MGMGILGGRECYLKEFLIGLRGRTTKVPPNKLGGLRGFLSYLPRASVSFDRPPVERHCPWEPTTIHEFLSDSLGHP
jgi:hypothetical protein